MQGVGWLGLGAFAGVITSLFAQAGVAWRWAVGHFWVRLELEGEESCPRVLNYLLAECRDSPGRVRRYRWRPAFIRPRGVRGWVAIESREVATLLFRGWAPVLYSPPVAQPPRANDPAGAREAVDRTAPAAFATVSFVRGTFDPDELIAAATSKWQDELSRFSEAKASVLANFYVTTIAAGGSDGRRYGRDDGAEFRRPGRRVDPVVGYADEDLGPPAGAGRLAGLYYPPEVHDEVEKIVRWRRSKEVYAKLGIPWRRGLLLHGPGGTGKTAFVVAVAKELNCPVYSFRLAGMTGVEFALHWDQLRLFTPCVALFEDFDGVFDGRENISRRDDIGAFIRGGRNAAAGDAGDGAPRDLLTFDTLLNCLDGADRCDGILTVVTTNCVRKIDPALGGPVPGGDGTASTRPGRIDRVIEMRCMRPADKERMVRALLRDFPETLAAVLADRESFDRDETPAQVQERVGQLALEAYEAALDAPAVQDREAAD